MTRFSSLLSLPAGVVWLCYVALAGKVKPVATVLPATPATERKIHGALKLDVKRFNEQGYSPQWGKALPSGLQLGVCVATDNTVYGFIRNNSAQPLRTNTYYCGYWETLALWARPAGNAKFQRLAYRKDLKFASDGIGATASDDVVLAPEEKILCRNDLETTARYFVHNIKLVAGAADAAIYYEEPKHLFTLFPYCFRQNLKLFDWPKGWQGQIEFYVEQKLGRDALDEKKPGVSSAILTVSMDALRANSRTTSAPVASDK